MRQLRATLWFTAIVQIWFGLLFTAVPSAAATLLDLPREPHWVDWLFVMMGARFLGYGIGLIIAARDPVRHRAWIDTMIGIQAVDWASTLVVLATGTVGLRNVTTAAILPPLIIAALVWWHPRRTATRGRDRKTTDTAAILP